MCGPCGSHAHALTELPKNQSLIEVAAFKCEQHVVFVYFLVHVLASAGHQALQARAPGVNVTR